MCLNLDEEGREVRKDIQFRDPVSVIFKRKDAVSRGWTVPDSTVPELRLDADNSRRYVYGSYFDTLEAPPIEYRQRKRRRHPRQQPASSALPARDSRGVGSTTGATPASIADTPEEGGISGWGGPDGADSGHGDWVEGVPFADHDPLERVPTGITQTPFFGRRRRGRT